MQFSLYILYKSFLFYFILWCNINLFFCEIYPKETSFVCPFEDCWEKVSQTEASVILTCCMLIYMHVISSAPCPLNLDLHSPHLVCVFVTSPSRFSFVSCFHSHALIFHLTFSSGSCSCLHHIMLSCFLQDIRTAGFIIKYTVYRKYFPPMTNIGVLHPVDMICALWLQTENTCQMTSAVWFLFVPRDVLFFYWLF